jgi:hypothetical protein
VHGRELKQHLDYSQESRKAGGENCGVGQGGREEGQWMHSEEGVESKREASARMRALAGGGSGRRVIFIWSKHKEHERGFYESTWVCVASGRSRRLSRGVPAEAGYETVERHVYWCYSRET